MNFSYFFDLYSNKHRQVIWMNLFMEFLLNSILLNMRQLFMLARNRIKSSVGKEHQS